MLAVYKIFLLFGCCFSFCECLYSSEPELKVISLDPKTIRKQRQETIDICKMFNEENESMQNSSRNIFKTYDFSGKMGHIKTELKKDREKNRYRRAKREVGLFVSKQVLKADDVLLVEGIVDKIYDDIYDRGENITYRRIIPGRGYVKSNKTAGRKFNFAPKELTYDKYETRTTTADHGGYMGTTPRFKHAIVPYFIDTKSYDGPLTQNILKAFDYLEKMTCINLKKLRTRPTDLKSLHDVLWLYITNPSGVRQCVHSNERSDIRGVQMVVFGYDCMSMGDILHEIMHVLGLSHEHTRPDRDQYVSIVWDNIKPGYKKYFEIIPDSVIANLPYDYSSVMHYPARAFSKNGQVTIKAKPGVKIGQRELLSELDIRKINTLYAGECTNRNTDYLLKTCPVVVQTDGMPKKPPPISKKKIEKYFENRIWPYGIINFKIRDMMEFSKEEMLNLEAAIKHIEKETNCIEFRYLGTIKDSKESRFDKSDKNDPNTIQQSSSVERFDTINNPELLLLNDTGASSSDTDKNKISDELKKSKETVNTKDINDELELDDSETIAPKVLSNEINKTNKSKASGETITEVDALYEDEQIKTDTESHRSIERFVTLDNDQLGSDKGKNKTDKAHEEIKETLNTVISDSVQSDYIKEDDFIGKPNTFRKKFIRHHTKQVQSRRSHKNSTPISPQRRHATNIIVLTRSSKPGCPCPKPGKPEGVMTIKIHADCFNSVNDLLHLLLHVLGLDHQHNMFDRDSYLHIVWNKLTPDVAKEMQNKLPPEASVGFPYDYRSVMHYPWLDIKNGRTNIIYPIWNDGWNMGYWHGLSPTDILKLNTLYWNQCEKRSADFQKVEDKGRLKRKPKPVKPKKTTPKIPTPKIEIVVEVDPKKKSTSTTPTDE